MRATNNIERAATTERQRIQLPNWRRLLTFLLLVCLANNALSCQIAAATATANKQQPQQQKQQQQLLQITTVTTTTWHEHRVMF